MLNDGKVIPVGETKPIPVDVRVIAATNRSLPAECLAGRFRPDLYYRLAVAALTLPPLRQRPGDLGRLIELLVEKANKTGEKEEPGYRRKALSPGAKNLLLNHPWPGNVRMLENTLMRVNKRIYILAGPNGAGKTTFAREFLTREASCPIFINADLIADGLSPFVPERAALRAGRIMLELIADAVTRSESFAFETTLASRNHARSIPEWRRQGYRVLLHFLSLPSPEFAILRVAERVRQGGHNVPEDVIRRRFAAGRDNFERYYKQLVDRWTLYDCAGDEPQAIDHGENP